MFDEVRFQDALTKYKKAFVESTWEGEKYKWEAVKCFQDTVLYIRISESSSWKKRTRKRNDS